MLISRLFIFILIFTSACIAFPTVAEETTNVPVPDEQVSITLSGGSNIKGVILEESDSALVIRTREGLDLTVPRDTIVAINPLHGRFAGSDFYRYDPNYSRLLFGPTGRALKKGHGYFSDYYIFFPGISYGVTDRFSFMAGMSLIPGINLGEQLKYFAPRYGIYQSENAATSVGFLNIMMEMENSAGIAFASHTIGKIDKSFTAAVGFGYLKEKGESVDFSESPIIMLGGNIRLTNYMAFVTENWFPTGFDLDLKYYPLTFALRFFNDDMAVDLGAIVVGELIQDGIPIPWLSFVYNFDH